MTIWYPILVFLFYYSQHFPAETIVQYHEYWTLQYNISTWGLVQKTENEWKKNKIKNIQIKQVSLPSSLMFIRCIARANSSESNIPAQALNSESTLTTMTYCTTTDNNINNNHKTNKSWRFQNNREKCQLKVLRRCKGDNLMKRMLKQRTERGLFLRQTVFRIRIHVFWASLSKYNKKNLDFYCFVTSFWLYIFENDV